ncbi:MAG: hypothetical protein ACREAB_11865 [Blastocatellia bacterium]
MKYHPTTNEDQTSRQTKTPLTPDNLTDPEKLVSAARKHFASGFPNPRRAGCPASGVIQATANAGQIPGDEVRAHLFRCSECFNEYRAAVLDHYRQTDSKSATADWRMKLRDALSRWRLPLLAGATALLLLAGGLFIWRQRQTAAPQSSQNRPQPAPTALIEDPPAPPMPQAGTAPPAQTANPGRAKPKVAESLAINLDLNRYNALGDSSRGGSPREEGTKIKLPPARALLKLRLRQGSEAGLYQISIVDPNSKPLVKTRARSPDGISLDAVLDLRRASQWAHRLRIERDDDLNEYLIEITKP